MIRDTTFENRLKKYLFDSGSKESVRHESMLKNIETPVPMINVFYENGSGEYPKNQDGFFIPLEQEEFVSLCLEKSKKFAEGDQMEFFKDKYDVYWRERFLRAWGSLIRDVHFNFMINERTDFDNIKYSIDEDRKKGSDCTIEHNNNEYHVNLYIASEKSKRFLQSKSENRDRTEKDAIDIRLPLYPTGPKKVIDTNPDDLWLYNREYIRGIEQIITGSKKYEYDGYKIAYTQ